MKTKVASLLVVLLLATISCMAQRTITVEAQNSDISNNLDLQAVASTFGESSDLEDFERRLNDYDSQISNLDLNNDGEVDYLRVIESTENNVHVVVIQAILDKEVFQDVATIVVERKDNRRTVVQVIGNSYIYGDNYVIEPVYVYTPSIFSFFWGYNYHRWYSPYYYGYYPRHFHYRRPFEVNIYLSHINSHINHDHRYFYRDYRRDEHIERLQHSISRNDYGTRYPDRNFSSRNANVPNKKAFDNSRGSNTVYDRSGVNSNRSDRSVYNNGSRSVENRSSVMNQRTNSPANVTRNSGNSRTQDDVYQNRTTRSVNSGSRNNSNTQNSGSRVERNTQTYTPANTQTNRNTEVNRSNENRTYQQRSTTNPTVERRQQPTVTRESNNSRPAPAVSQPSRTSESRSVERKPAENNSSRGTSTKSENRSSNNDNSRRR